MTGAILILLMLGAPVAAQEWLATGTYIGDFNSPRAITGIGFQPDVVIVKGDNNRSAIIRTSTMGPTISRELGGTAVYYTDGIASLDADGFSVGSGAVANSGGVTYCWTAMRAAEGIMDVGTYTGDGTDNHWVTVGLYQPDAVLIMGEDSWVPWFRHIDMPNDASTPLIGGGLTSGGINGLYFGGFTVSGDVEVNSSGTPYHYISWQASPNLVTAESYLGDGQDNRELGGLDQAPSYVLIKSAANEHGQHRMDSVVGPDSPTFDPTDFQADRIQALGTDGFQLGSHNTINENGETFYYVSFANAITNSDLAVSLVADRTEADEGDTVTFDLLVENNGPDTVNEVSGSATLPTGISYLSSLPTNATYDNGTGQLAAGSLIPGDSALLRLVGIVDSGTAASTLTASATITGTGLVDSVPENNSASASVDILAQADLAVEATFDPAGAAVGDTVRFTIVGKNLGPNDAAGVEFFVERKIDFDYLGANATNGSYNQGSQIWTRGDMNGGTVDTLSVSLVIPAGMAGSTVTPVAYVANSGVSDPVAANDSTSATLVVAGSADLTLSAAVAEAALAEGDTTTLTFAVANSGPGNALHVQLTHTLPSGLTLLAYETGGGSFNEGTGVWDLGTMTNGAVDTLRLQVEVDGGTAGSTLSDAAQLTSDSFDLDLSNNDATLDLNIYLPVDLTLAVQTTDPTPAVGDLIDLRVVVTNNSGNDADAVEVLAPLPAGLEFDLAGSTSGAYVDSTGIWTLGTLAAGVADTLTLTVRVGSGTGETVLTFEPAITGLAQPDTAPADNSLSFELNVEAPPIVTATVTAGQEVPSSQGDRIHPVLTLTLTNSGSAADTLRSFTVTNTTTGEGTTEELDSVWQELSVVRSVPVADIDVVEKAAPTTAVFSGGEAVFEDLDWIVEPGEDLQVIVQGAPSYSAPTGYQLALAVLRTEHIELAKTTAQAASWPLADGTVLTVGGFPASALTLIEVDSSPLAVGSIHNPALEVHIPSDGFLADELLRLNIINHGSAQPDTDIERMEAWADDGDLVFDPLQDELIGSFVFTGDRWELTGLTTTIPVGGLRVFVSVDITETAAPAGNAVRLGIPGPPDEGIGMVRRNDGPSDTSLDNTVARGISVSDRIILTTQWIHPGVVYPAAGDLPLIHLIATNTYTDDRTLQRIVVTNATEGSAEATIPDLDATSRQVALRWDAGNIGELDDATTDPTLGSGSYADGRVEFSGLDLNLPAGSAVHLFVTTDLGLMTVADGDRISALISTASDIDVTNSTIVGNWPLDSGAQWSVDGMVADQVEIAPVNVLTLGPDDGPALVLDFTVPSNGYLEDELLGVGLANQGSADENDFSVVQLWEDGGDGAFDAADTGSDDTLLGPMLLQSGKWISSALSRTVPIGGLRLFASLTVSSTPQDSATVRFTIPTGGLTTANGNSGPLDRPVEEPGTLVLSTSPLLSALSLVTNEVTIGQSGEVRMTVSNRGGERVNGITPELSQLDGSAGLTLGPPTPASTDLVPGSDAVFTWSFTSAEAGDAVLEGGASGIGQDTALARRSIHTPTSALTVYSPVPGIDLYPVTNLPFSINRGQVGVIPLTLTLANPGSSTVANGRLDSIQLVLRESPGGPVIAPADLLTRLVIREGTDIYADMTAMPSEAAPFTVALDHPALITGSEPVTLGIRFDLRGNSTVPSFLLSIDEGSWFTVSDAVSGLAVPLSLGEGSFPVQSGQGNLVTQATALELAVTDRAESAAGPGQTDVVLAEMDLSNISSDGSSSAIELGALCFAFRGEDGEKLATPQDVFSRLRLASSFQDHFDGAISADSDSQVVLQLSPPVLVPGNTTLTLRLHGDVTDEPLFGSVVPLVGNLLLFDARDANTGASIAISLTTSAAAAATRILGAAETVLVDGDALLPEFVPQGAVDIEALAMTFTHPGEAGIAPISIDTLSVKFTDNARQAINPAAYLDAIHIVSGETELAVVGRTNAPGGSVDIGMIEVLLEPGQSADVLVRLDFRPDAPSESLQMSVGQGGIHAHDEVRDIPLAVVPDPGASLPLVSGTARIVAAADELIVGAENRLPAILAAQVGAFPALTLTFENPASAQSGAVEIDELTIRQPSAARHALGAMAATVRLLHGEDIWSEVETGVTDEAITFTGTEPLSIPAGEDLEVLIEIVLRTDPPDGSIALQIDAADIVARPADVISSTVFVSAMSGQSFPLKTSTATLSAADLEGSYANYPNPFEAGRESTTFVYSLPTAATVTLRLLTPHGEPVATVLDHQSVEAGLRQIDQWDGINGKGKTVRNGVYIAELTAEFADGSRERVLRKVAVVR